MTKEGGRLQTKKRKVTENSTDGSHTKGNAVSQELKKTEGGKAKEAQG